MAKKKKAKKAGNSKWGAQVLALFGLVTAFVFMPTTAMMVIAMLPTIAAGFSDRIRGETRALTIGAMNVAGCTPFLLQLWTSGHNLDNALSIISDPLTIVVVYSAAGVGWIIDWATAGMVATIMQQSGVRRLADIKARQAALVERWGPEVTGDLPLDPYGFPVEAVADDDTVADSAARRA
jgi:hypothetical protein